MTHLLHLHQAAAAIQLVQPGDQPHIRAGPELVVPPPIRRLPLEPAQMGSEVVIFYTDSLELAVLSYHTEC